MIYQSERMPVQKLSLKKFGAVRKVFERVEYIHCLKLLPVPNRKVHHIILEAVRENRHPFLNIGL
jgi:hypothetical protein